MPLDIITENRSFFDNDNKPRANLISLQTDPSAPGVSGLDVATGMVLPDKSIVSYRLRHFPGDLYDLRDTSHLVRLMKALLGPAGIGQLRSRSMLAQFQQAATSTHFYDLDRFYGAIFGMTRTVGELLAMNPTTDTATQNEWDRVDDADADFRDRIFELARAINLGATRPGLQAAAEALMRTPVEVYETWSLLDSYEGDLSGVHVGRTGTNSRSEVIVAPSKDYAKVAEESGEDEANRQRAEDAHNLTRVLSVLRPANVLLTVDPDGLDLLREAPMINLVADSNFWNIATQTTPNANLVAPNGTPYPVSIQQALDSVLASDTHEIPKPPFSVTQAARWSYAPEVVSVTSSSYRSTAPVRALPGAPSPDPTTPSGSGGGGGGGGGGVPPSDVKHGVVRCGTYNVHVVTSPGETAADLAHLITRVDVLALQEWGHDHPSLEDGWLASHGWDSFHCSLGVADTAMAWDRSVYDMLSHDFQELNSTHGSNGANAVRHASYALLKDRRTGFQFWYVSLHTVPVPGAGSLHQTEHAEQFTALNALYDRLSASAPVLMAGDYNEPNPPMKGLKTCWENVKASGGIDNIMADPRVGTARSAERIRGLHSDHPAVVTVYAVTSPRTATPKQNPTTVEDRTAPGDPLPSDATDLPSVVYGGKDMAGTAKSKVLLGDSDTITYGDGTTETFGAKRGILDPRRALAARYASEGLLVAHPYSGDRKKAH